MRRRPPQPPPPPPPQPGYTMYPGYYPAMPPYDAFQEQHQLFAYPQNQLPQQPFVFHPHPQPQPPFAFHPQPQPYGGLYLPLQTYGDAHFLQQQQAPRTSVRITRPPTIQAPEAAIPAPFGKAHIQPSRLEAGIPARSSQVPVQPSRPQAGIPSSSSQAPIKPSRPEAAIPAPSGKAQIQPSRPQAAIPAPFGKAPIQPSRPESGIPARSSQAPVQPSRPEARIPARSSQAPVQQSRPEAAIPSSSSQAPIKPSRPEANIPSSSTIEAPIQNSEGSVQRPKRAPKFPAPVPTHLYGPAEPICQSEVRTLFIRDLPSWIDENRLTNSIKDMDGVTGVRVARDQYMQSRMFGFIEFKTRDLAETALNKFNRTSMPHTEYNFCLSWATLKGDCSYDIFCAKLPNDVSDSMLRSIFSSYSSVTRAHVVRDIKTSCSKGFGFVSFQNFNEREQALSVLNGHKWRQDADPLKLSRMKTVFEEEA